jgi:Zn-dependent M28 family amino/carboxypeptidase
MHCAKIAAALLALAASCATGAEFSGASALEFTKKAVAFGPRPPATEANKKLQGYIEAQLRSFGCAVTPDPFTASTPLGPKPMRNIVVRIPGRSGKAIVITGHFDTKTFPGRFFVGANDGGSSTGLLLELARVLCKQPRKDDLYLVFLDGEEAYAEWSDTDSLYGSRHLSEKWQREGFLPKAKALINVDMIGDSDLQLVQEMASTAWLRDLVWQTARELGYSRNFPPLTGTIADDHRPFLDKGVPALDLIDFDYGPNHAYWHSDQDTMDKLSANSFTVLGKVLIKAIEKLEAR